MKLDWTRTFVEIIIERNHPLNLMSSYNAKHEGEKNRSRYRSFSALSVLQRTLHGPHQVKASMTQLFILEFIIRIRIQDM